MPAQPRVDEKPVVFSRWDGEGACVPCVFGHQSDLEFGREQGMLVAMSVDRTRPHCRRIVLVDNATPNAMVCGLLPGYVFITLGVIGRAVGGGCGTMLFECNRSRPRCTRSPVPTRTTRK